MHPTPGICLCFPPLVSLPYMSVDAGPVLPISIPIGEPPGLT